MSITKTAGNEILVAPLGQIVMAVYAKPWNDTVWTEHCEQVVGVAGAVPNLRGLFNYSPKQGPNPAQRKQMVALSQEVTASVERVALVTDSVLIRGVLTAFGWLLPGKKLSTWAPSEVEACLRWLAVSANFGHDEAMALFKEMKSLGGLP